MLPPNATSMDIPPNATSIMQPLDQGIILSVKRKYKKKLAEIYLMSVKKNKDTNALLKSLDIVPTTNMVAASWMELHQLLFRITFANRLYAPFHGPQPEEPPVTPDPAIWSKLQRWMDVNFDDFVANEPEGPTTQPMMDEDVVDAPQEESEDEEEEINSLYQHIKTTKQYLAIINQKKPS